MDRESMPGAGGYPDVAAIRGEDDVVREEWRRERALETGTARVVQAEHRNALGPRAERRPYRRSVRIDRHVPGRPWDGCSRDDARAGHVDGHDLGRARVRDVGDPAARMHRRIARRSEPVELEADVACTGVDERDAACLRVRDQRESRVDGFDAPRPGSGADAGELADSRRLEHENVVLEVRSDESDRASGRGAWRRDGEPERSSGGRE
jgi:hypothetical protein